MVSSKWLEELAVSFSRCVYLEIVILLNREDLFKFTNNK